MADIRVYTDRYKKDNKKSKVSTREETIKELNKKYFETRKYNLNDISRKSGQNYSFDELYQDILKKQETEVAEISEKALTEKLPPVGGFVGKISDTVGDVGGSFVKGVTQGLEGIVDFLIGSAGWVGGLFGADKKWAEDAVAFDFADWWANTGVGSALHTGQFVSALQGRKLNDIQANSYAEGNKVGEFVTGTAETVGEFLPTVIASIYTGGAYGAVAAGAVSAGATFARTAGQSTEKALQGGNDLNTAYGYGVASGAVNAALDLATQGIASKGGGVTTKILGKIGGETAKNLAKNTAFKIATKAGEQGLRAVVQNYANVGLQRAILKNDAPMPNTSQALEIFITSAATSAIMQGIMESKPVKNWTSSLAQKQYEKEKSKWQAEYDSLKAAEQIYENYYDDPNFSWEKHLEMGQTLRAAQEKFARDVEKKFLNRYHADIFNKTTTEETTVGQEMPIYTENLNTSESGGNELAKIETTVQSPNSPQSISISPNTPILGENELVKSPTMPANIVNEIKPTADIQTASAVEKTTQQNKVETTPMQTADEVVDGKIAKKESMLNSIEKTKNIPANYVKAWADLKERKVFDKVEAKKIVDNIIEDLKTNKQLTYKGGKDILVEVIFQQMNKTSSGEMFQTINDVANHITDYAVAENKLMLSKDEKKYIVELLKKEVTDTYLEKGRFAKTDLFKKWAKSTIKTLVEKVKEVKKINKVVHKNIGLVRKLKTDYLKRDYKVGDILPNELISAGKPLGKIVYRDYISGKSREFIQSYGLFRAELENNGVVELSPEIKADIDLINSKPVNVSFDLEDANALNRILKEFVYQIKNFDTIRINNQKESTRKTVKFAIHLSKSRKPLGTIDKIGTPLIKPSNYLGNITQFRESHPLTKWIKDLQHGEEHKKTIIRHENEKIIKAFGGEKELKKYILKSKREKVVFNDMEIPKASIMKAYAYTLRKQAHSHILSGGIAFYDSNNKKIGEIKSANVEQLKNDLELFLNDQDKKWLNLVTEFYTNKAPELIKKTEIAIRGFSSVEFEEDYTGTIIIAAGELNQNVDVDITKGLLNYGWRKPTTKQARQQIVAGDIFFEFDRMVSEIASFAALSSPIKSFNQLMNQKVNVDNEMVTLRKEMERIDPNFFPTIKTMVETVATDRYVGKNWLEKTLDKTMENVSFAAIASPIIAVKQFLSYPLAGVYLNMNSLIYGATHTLPKDVKELVKKHIPYVANRLFDKTYVKTSLLAEGLSRIQEVTLTPHMKADETVLWHVVAGALHQTSKTSGHSVYTEENIKAAKELIETIGKETQTNALTTERSALQNSKNPLLRMFARFSIDSSRQWNILIGLINQGRVVNSRIEASKQWMEHTEKVLYHSEVGSEEQANAKQEYEDAKQTYEEDLNFKKKYKKYSARAATALVTTLIIMSLLDMVITRFKGRKKEDESNTKEFFSNMSSNIAGFIPIGREIYGYFADGYEISSPQFEAINKFMASVKSIIDDGEYSNKKLRDAIFALSDITGLPSRSLHNFVFDIIRNFSPETAENYNNLFYSKTKAKQIEEISLHLSNNNFSKADTLLENMLKENETPIEDAKIRTKMLDLIKSGFVNVIPKSLKDKKSITHLGIDYEFEKDTLKEFKQTYSKANNQVSKMLGYSAFQALSEESQAKAIAALYEDYFYEALYQTFDVSNSEGVERKSYAELDVFLPAYKLAAYHAHVKTIRAEENKTKKQKVREYINRQKLSKNQKELVYNFVGY